MTIPKTMDKTWSQDHCQIDPQDDHMTILKTISKNIPNSTEMIPNTIPKTRNNQMILDSKAISTNMIFKGIQKTMPRRSQHDYERYKPFMIPRQSQDIDKTISRQSSISQDNKDKCVPI